MEGVCGSKSIPLKEHDSSIFEVCDNLLKQYCFVRLTIKKRKKISWKTDAYVVLIIVTPSGMSPHYFQVLFSTLRLKTEPPNQGGGLNHAELQCILNTYRILLQGSLPGLGGTRTRTVKISRSFLSDP